LGEPKPYKVRSTEPGSADVIDRKTSMRVGYVLADFYANWQPCLCDEGSYGMWGTPFGGKFRYRADAVEAVWKAQRG
jgi:hypothetical protein